MVPRDHREFIDMLETREEKELSGGSRKRNKGAWGIPRLSEAMKDAASCENRRGAAHTL